MNITIDPIVAQRFDSDTAILLSIIKQAVEFERANEASYFENKHWVKISVAAFSKLMPWLNHKQVDVRLKRLENAKLIHTGTFNQYRWDQTKWYSI